MTPHDKVIFRTTKPSRLLQFMRGSLATALRSKPLSIAEPYWYQILPIGYCY